MICLSISGPRNLRNSATFACVPRSTSPWVFSALIRSCDRFCEIAKEVLNDIPLPALVPNAGCASRLVAARHRRVRQLTLSDDVGQIDAQDSGGLLVEDGDAEVAILLKKLDQDIQVRCPGGGYLVPHGDGQLEGLEIAAPDAGEERDAAGCLFQGMRQELLNLSRCSRGIRVPRPRLSRLRSQEAGRRLFA